MILYLSIIFGGVVVIGCANAAFSDIAFGEAFAAVGICLLCMVVLDAVIAAIIHALPPSLMRPFDKIYAISPAERKLYERAGIRVWKDVIPETGKYLCHFAKDKIADPNDNEYILQFLRETCYAEIMHFLSLALSFPTLFFLPYTFNIALPVVLVNAFLQLLPAVTQRYNRDRLIHLYRYNERKQARRAQAKETI